MSPSLEPDILESARQAAMAADTEAFRPLLDAHPELAQAICPGHGSNLLYDAAYGGSVEICRMLVDAGCSPERLPENECSPDKPHFGPGSQTPLAHALESGRTDAAKYLASVAMVPDNLWMAAALGNRARIEALVAPDGRLHPDARDPNKVGDDAFVLADALVAAAHQRHNEAALLLIERGANPSGRDQFGMTAAHYAVQCNLELLRRLAERGADMRLRDWQYNATPYGWARFGGHAEAVRFLEEHCELDPGDRP